MLSRWAAFWRGRPEPASAPALQLCVRLARRRGRTLPAPSSPTHRRHSRRRRCAPKSEFQREMVFAGGHSRRASSHPSRPKAMACRALARASLLRACQCTAARTSPPWWAPTPPPASPNPAAAASSGVVGRGASYDGGCWGAERACGRPGSASRGLASSAPPLDLEREVRAGGGGRLPHCSLLRSLMFPFTGFWGQGRQATREVW